MRLILSILLILVVVPGWTGAERLPLFDRDARLFAHRLHVSPAERRIGALRLVGVMRLWSDAPAFGGFSALAVRRGRVAMLNDGGNRLSFAIRRGRPVQARTGYLPDGPGTGWEKRDRDSESIALDPVTGRAWVGFENANAIWRYAPGLRRAERFVRPEAMRRWPLNGGAEAVVRLRDGRFVVLAERGAKRRHPKPGLIFPRDPTLGDRPARFAFRPPAGYDPTDAAELPGGDLLVLTRRFRWREGFTAKLVRVPRARLTPGALVSGREIATLAGPTYAENWEGLALTRESGATMVWLVSDEDVSAVQRTLLAKFRLDQTPESPPVG